MKRHASINSDGDVKFEFKSKIPKIEKVKSFDFPPNDEI